MVSKKRARAVGGDDEHPAEPPFQIGQLTHERRSIDDHPRAVDPWDRNHLEQIEGAAGEEGHSPGMGQVLGILHELQYPRDIVVHRLARGVWQLGSAEATLGDLEAFLEGARVPGATSVLRLQPEVAGDDPVLAGLELDQALEGGEGSCGPAGCRQRSLGGRGTRW